jgi:MFS family permease
MSERTEGESGFSYASLLTTPTLVAMMLSVFVVMFGYEIPAPILTSIAEGIAVSDAEIGLIMTAFAVPGVLFLPVTGIAADLYGRKAVLVPSLVGFGIAGTAIGFVDSFAVVLALRVLQGTAFAGILPISVAVLGDTFEGARGSAAQGFRTSAAGAATLVVPPAAGYLASFAWEYAFWMHVLAFAVAALVLVAVPETVESAGSGPGLVETMGGYLGTITTELKDRQLGILVAGGFVRGFVRLAFLTFIPLFAVRVFDASLVEAGLVLSARGAARMLFPPLSGVVTGRFSRRFGVMGSLVIIGASAAAMPFSPSIVGMGLLLFGYSLGDSFFSPLLKDAVANHAPDERRAGVINAYFIFQNGGEMVAPAAFGAVLAVIGFAGVFFAMAAVVAVYAAAVVVFFASG